MSLHSVPRPFMGTKLTEILLPTPLVIPLPTVVVESPALLYKRFVGLESFVDGGGGGGAVFEGNPCHLTVVLENAGELLGIILNFRLVLRGTPGFPDGIEIHRGRIDASVVNQAIDVFPRGLCMEPGERVELEVLANDNNAILTTARVVKIVASYCDYSNSIVRTKRTKLTTEYQDIFPSPPPGLQNSPISKSNGLTEYSFFACQPGGGSFDGALQLDDEGTTASLGEETAPDPSAASPFVDGTSPMKHAGVTLDEGQKIQALFYDGSNPTDTVALTTWMQISTAD